MAKLIILGSSNAVASQDNENTHMVLVGEERTVMVDCVNNPIRRLEQMRISFHELTDMILTHFHPDHVSGVPLMLMDMWLQGRRKPLHIYGLHYTVDRMEKLMGMYSWEDWPNFFPVAFHRLPASEMTPVMDCDDFAIFSSPVRHLIPTIGLRVAFNRQNKIMAYSCDTEPCEEVVRLADHADALIHEATGDSQGHSSAEQAGMIATQAKAKKLYLIHYPTGEYSEKDLCADARRSFQGEVNLAVDYMTLDFG